MHPSLTLKRIMAAAKRSMMSDVSAGFCTACGRRTKPGQFVEPDARGYTCAYKSCGQPAVYGAEELLSMVAP